MGSSLFIPISPHHSPSIPINPHNKLSALAHLTFHFSLFTLSVSPSLKKNKKSSTPKGAALVLIAYAIMNVG
jgi:hypothetical protein